jgi:serine/threonine protein kinase
VEHINSLPAGELGSARSGITLARVLGWAYDTISAIEHLHSNQGGNVVHGDIQPRNLLVFERGTSAGAATGAGSG